MATEPKKQFLDYAGLQTFWSIITGRFADKNKTITKQEIVEVDGNYGQGDDNFGKKTLQLVSTLADNTTTVATKLPLANRTTPGLMTPDHYTIVDDLHANIEKMAPFAGLQLANEIGDTKYTEELSLTGRKATIALRYDAEGEGDERKAYISLLDPNYPAEGQWNTKTEDEYLAAVAANGGNAPTGWATYFEDGQNKYWQWSIAGQTGPVNALGKPISRKPISKIDVTDLLRTGLLQATDVVSKGGKTMLKLSFIVKSPNGTDAIETQYIDVSDLVDIYEAGDGIEIVTRTSDPTTEGDGDVSLDDTPTSTKIQLTYATDSKRGALRTGYTAAETATRHYAVQLVSGEGPDAGRAYVCIPWDNHTVDVFSEGVDVNGKSYLTIEDLSSTAEGEDGSTLHKHQFKIEVAEGIKNAEKLARTAAQNIYGDSVTTGEGEQAVTVKYINVASTIIGGDADHGEGTNWTITLDQTVKDSLALADSAVQTVTVSDVTRDGRSDDTKTDLVLTSTGVDDKGQKKYDIALGARTIESLQNADSAIQTINLFGTEIRNASDNTDVDVAYTEAQLTEDIKLGSAIKANVSSTISKSDDSTDTSESSYVNAETGAKDVKDNLPTVKAVKTYVEDVKSDITTEYEEYVGDTIASLDSKVDAGTIDATDTAQGKVAKAIFTKIVIKDGKLVAPDASAEEADPILGKSEVAKLSIEDITDFRALNEDEIYAICGATKPTPEA